MIICDDIQIIQGSLGSGKSMIAMQELVMQLLAGGVVACNFTLTPNWAYELAGQSIWVKLGFRDRLERAKSFWDRAFKIGSPESMIELSGERGSNLEKMCIGQRKGKREGKGLLILDDCHHFFNSRTFQKNKGYVAFFANARKYGWRTLLISHSVDNIDSQIRSYIEIESRFRNLQKVKIPFTPFPVSPVPAFVVRRKYYGLGPGTGQNHSLDFYLFDKRIASLYDTLERFVAEDVLDDYKKQGIEPILPKKKTKSVYSTNAETWPEYHKIVKTMMPENAPGSSIMNVPAHAPLDINAITIGS